MGIRLKNVEMEIRKKRPENRLKKFLKKFEKNTCIFLKGALLFICIAQRQDILYSTFQKMQVFF